ncbi:hypothetical protein [Ferrimonas sediminum]|uniref:hypothetical protein n=1 Tax=Ferrimonas sediminum TaxID=718193 RepID=UPI00115FF60A|nr:hypothetical protein [Ferrimonas sediminum]
MNIFQMMRTGELPPMVFGLFLQAIALAGLCFLLARSKNRSWKLAVLAGVIPMFNYLAVLYYVGVPKAELSQPESSNNG